MKDLQQPPTTSYGSKGKIGQYNLENPPIAEHICKNLSQVGKIYGNVEIVSPERRYTKGWSQVYVLTKCLGCGRIQWTYLSNLMQGKSKGCQMCSKPRQIPRWLDRRFTAAKQRCENPKDGNYQNYGARGIKFCFSSVLEAGLWMIEHCGLPDRSMELDRIDVNGNYEPGNMRWVTHQQNCANQRRYMTSSIVVPGIDTP